MSSSPLLANTIPETETKTSVLILSVSMIKLSIQTASNFKKFNHGHFAIRNKACWVSRGKAKLHSCVGFYGCQHFPTPPLCFFFFPVLMLVVPSPLFSSSHLPYYRPPSHDSFYTIFFFILFSSHSPYFGPPSLLSLSFPFFPEILFQYKSKYNLSFKFPSQRDPYACFVHL